jgi:transcription elongation factor Elf1
MHRRYHSTCPKCNHKNDFTITLEPDEEYITDININCESCNYEYSVGEAEIVPVITIESEFYKNKVGSMCNGIEVFVTSLCVIAFLFMFAGFGDLSERRTNSTTVALFAENILLFVFAFRMHIFKRKNLS